MTDAKRQAADRKAAERNRKRAAGLVPIELWIPPQLAERVRKYVNRLVAKMTR